MAWIFLSILYVPILCMIAKMMVGYQAYIAALHTLEDADMRYKEMQIEMVNRLRADMKPFHDARAAALGACDGLAKT